VGIAGRADIDYIDVIAADDLAPVRLRGFPAEFDAGGLEAVGVTPDDHRHPRFDGQIEESWRHTPRL
jgi:hypothetical protein